MNFATLLTNFFLFYLSLISLVHAIIYAPPILTPCQGEVWTVGQSYTITWNITNPPAYITNYHGVIRLRKGGRTIMNMTLGDNFDIFDGSLTVTVPNVEPGADYHIVLFGNSGNWNPGPFEIISAHSNSDTTSEPDWSGSTQALMPSIQIPIS